MNDWALDYADYEIEYRDGVCFTELEKDLKDMLSCQLCCPRHQRNKPNLDDLKLMFNGAYPKHEKDVLPYVCNCPCRSNARIICENNAGEYENLISMINETSLIIRAKNEFMNAGKEKKNEFYERELPYVIYFHTSMDDDDAQIHRYGYLVRYGDYVYDLIVRRYLQHDDDYWTLENVAIVDKEEYYNTFDGDKRRILKYVDYSEDILDDKKYFSGFDQLFYRKELEQLNTCKCCQRHQIKKPSLNDFDAMFNGEYETGSERLINYDCECDCKCRSNARHICRNNVKTYNMLKELILNASFEILPYINEELEDAKKTLRDFNLHYLSYYVDYAIKDGDIDEHYILIRIDGDIYDIRVQQFQYEDVKYLDNDFILHKAVIIK